MIKKTKCVPLILFVLTITVSVSAAQDRLIYFPLRTFPVIVEQGKNFTIKIKAAAGDNMKISLLLFENEYPIQIQGIGVEDGFTVVNAAVPAGIPSELYDLKVTASRKEIQKRSVKVVSSFKKDYYFVHLTDTHIYESNDFFKKVIDEINLINPEFVILTGDLIMNGEDLCRTLMRSNDSAAHYLGGPAKNEIYKIIRNEYETFFKFLDDLRAPVFVIPGNHDMAGSLNPVCEELWEEYFVYRYYSFNYGEDHFAGLDNSQMFETAKMVYPEADLVAIKEFDPEQIQWAQNDLEANKDSRLTALFFHCPVSNKKSMIYTLADKYKVSLILIGHLHTDVVRRQGKTPTLWIMTRNAPVGYRLVRINQGKIASWGYKQCDESFSKRNEGSSKFLMEASNVENVYALDLGKLNLEYDRSNDGSREMITAKISNKSEENFEDALLRFLVKNGDYSVSGGEIIQEIPLEDKKLVYVKVSIPAGSDIEVKIQKK